MNLLLNRQQHHNFIDLPQLTEKHSFRRPAGGSTLRNGAKPKGPIKICINLGNDHTAGINKRNFNDYVGTDGIFMSTYLNKRITQQKVKRLIPEVYRVASESPNASFS